MPLSRLSCPGVWGEETVDPRDMTKAGLPEVQSPVGAGSPPTGKTSETGAGPLLRAVEEPAATSGGWAMSSEDIQGDEWTVYVTLYTYARDERGIA